MNIHAWKKLSDEERATLYKSWIPQGEMNEEQLLQEIVDSFRADYPELEVKGLANVFGSLMISADHPFIFDERKLTPSYLGIPIRYSHSEGLPEGFEVYEKYTWAPENYLNYVTSHAHEIRQTLMLPAAQIEELLEALIGQPFDDWIKQCREWGYTDMKPGDRELPRNSG